MTDRKLSESGDTCVLCEAANHEPCESYTQVYISEFPHNQGAVVDVCLAHYEAIGDATR